MIPGLGVNYSINSKIELLAGIHKGFSPPGPGSNESEEIKPEESINLEDSVKSFEEGVNLVKQCQKHLQDAELKIKKLLDDGSSIEIDKS